MENGRYRRYQTVFLNEDNTVLRQELDSDILVIQGIRDDGDELRPRDWNERISAFLASFGADHRLQYSQSAQPCILNGARCLVVARGLEQSDPNAYAFIMEFADTNHLKIFTDRRLGQRALRD